VDPGGVRLGVPVMTDYRPESVRAALFDRHAIEQEIAHKIIWFDENGHWMAYFNACPGHLRRRMSQYARRCPVWVWPPGHPLPHLDYGVSAMTPEAIVMRLHLEDSVRRTLLPALERTGREP